MDHRRAPVGADLEGLYLAGRPPGRCATGKPWDIPTDDLTPVARPGPLLRISRAAWFLAGGAVSVTVLNFSIVAEGGLSSTNVGIVQFHCNS